MQLSENVIKFLQSNGIDLNSPESQRATKLQQFIDGQISDDKEYKSILLEAVKGNKSNPDQWAKDQINAILVKQMAEAIENYVERFKTI